MKKYFLLISFLTFSFFVLFSFLVHEDVFIQFDFNTTVRLQDAINSKFDPFFSLLSDIGVFEISLGFLIVVLLVLRKIRGLLVIGFFGLLHLIELYGKTFVDHLPPPEFLLRTKHLIDFPQFHVRLENSFPSGHAARAAFITFFLGLLLLKSKKFSWKQKVFIWVVLASFDVAMIVSRVYLGEHWASDVTGGALLGIALGILSVVFI